MACATTTNIEACACLAANNVLFLIHNARHIAQGIVKIKRILLAYLIFGNHIILRAKTGLHRHCWGLVGNAKCGYCWQIICRQAALGKIRPWA